VKIGAVLLREPGERPLPPGMVSPTARSRGRPRKGYRPRIRSARDVDLLRRHHVPALLLTADWVSRSGYPVQFRPWLALPERLVPNVSSEFRVLPVKDEGCLREPGVVELVTLLLRFDVLAARVVASRNRSHLDPNELYRRVRNEGLESAATKVRLQEFSPAIPVVGSRLPRDELSWVERNNPPLREPA
jgi:hypothetical protein